MEKPPWNPWENMRRPTIFKILGAQKQEHHIDPLRASHVTYKELNLGGDGYQPFLPTSQDTSNQEKCILLYMNKRLFVIQNV
jgi:hypothetical protein